MITRPMSEDDLQSFVDDRLDTSRRSEVEGYLEGHDDARMRVARMVGLREDLRAAFAPIAAEPVPAHLNLSRIVESHRRPRMPVWQAAAALLFVVGGATGWGLRELAAPASSGIAALALEASTNFAVYAPDRRHPVELAAVDQSELAGWFSARLKRSIVVPDLTGSGYRLMGGRLVATPHGPAGLLMYDDGHGARFVMLMRPMADPGDVPMREHTAGSSNGIAWAQDGLGYSLVGATDHSVLRPLADEIRRSTTKST